MIKLKKRNTTKAPEMMLSPMIDMIFLLLVFFILSTMYMSEVKTIPIKMPAASNSTLETQANFNITVKADGSVWLDDKKADVGALVMQAAIEQKRSPKFAVIIRGDKDVNYNNIISLLDKLKGVNVTRVGLATDVGEAK
ncbi:MAG: biopolymer transporter ExbD [Acidaminococcaceae bacterium]|nr:biopolymer transporter ExbD [Acidaminococcaceae bacterium]